MFCAYRSKQKAALLALFPNAMPIYEDMDEWLHRNYAILEATVYRVYPTYVSFELFIANGLILRFWRKRNALELFNRVYYVPLTNADYPAVSISDVLDTRALKKLWKKEAKR